MADHVEASTLLRQTEILRHPVLHASTLESLGRVDVLWMYPQVNRVLGIVCKQKRFGGERLVFKLPQLQTVKDQVLVTGAAEETTLDKVQKLESLIGSEVWSDEGDRVGTITDCLFDLNSGVIIRYLVVLDGRWPQAVAEFADGLYLLSPKHIKSFSPRRVLVAEADVAHLRVYSEGIRLRLAHMAATLKQDYWHGAVDEWRSLSSHVQSIASRATEQIRTLAEKARETAQSFAQTFSETVVSPDSSPESPSSDAPNAPDASGASDMSSASEPEGSWVDDDWIDSVKDTVQTKGQAIASDLQTRSKPLVERLKTVSQAMAQSLDALEMERRWPSPESETWEEPEDEERVTDDWANDIWADDDMPTPASPPTPDRASVDRAGADELGAGDVWPAGDGGVTGAPSAAAAVEPNWTGADPWDDWDDDPVDDGDTSRVAGDSAADHDASGAGTERRKRTQEAGEDPVAGKPAPAPAPAPAPDSDDLDSDPWVI